MTIMPWPSSRKSRSLTRGQHNPPLLHEVRHHTGRRACHELAKKAIGQPKQGRSPWRKQSPCKPPQGGTGVAYRLTGGRKLISAKGFAHPLIVTVWHQGFFRSLW